MKPLKQLAKTKHLAKPALIEGVVNQAQGLTEHVDAKYQDIAKLTSVTEKPLPPGITSILGPVRSPTSIRLSEAVLLSIFQQI